MSHGSAKAPRSNKFARMWLTRKVSDELAVLIDDIDVETFQCPPRANTVDVARAETVVRRPQAGVRRGQQAEWDAQVCEALGSLPGAGWPTLSGVQQTFTVQWDGVRVPV